MLTIIGVTYSYLAPIISGVETESTIAFNSGMIKITYNGSNIITGENIIPGWSSTKEFTVVGYNNTSVTDEDIMDYAIKLVVEENTFTNGAIRFELTGSSTNDADTLSPLTGKVPTGEGRTLVGTARFSQDDSIKSDVTHTYNLKISFPNDPNKSQNENMNKTFKGYVIVEEGELYIQTFEDYLLALDYDSNGLKEDDFGNLRYVGATPNNYIKFNNETWRIIGIVDDGVKIVKEESIANSRWSSTSNNWEISRPLAYLTGYYNSLSEVVQSQIQERTWHLGGWNPKVVSALDMYKYERGIGNTGTIGEEYHVYGSNPTTWDGNIALMYSSDYGYASNTEACTNSLQNCDDSTATANNWLYRGINEWLLTPFSDSDNFVFCVISSGAVPYGVTAMVDSTWDVRPCLYLKSNIIRTNGDGASPDTAYEIKLN